jgi:hypothetical protein
MWRHSMTAREIQGPRNERVSVAKSRSSRFATLALSCVALFSFAAPSVQAQTTTRFNDGYLTVFRVTSASTLASTGTAIVLDEYAPTGSSQSTPNYSLSLPSVTSGLGVNDIVVSGSAASSGGITRSENGRYIAIPGYKNLIGDANTLFNTTAVVRLANGTGTMSAGISGANYSSGNNNLRGAVTDDGNFFWCTGNGTGVIGVALSAPTTLTTVSSTSLNNRYSYIYNAQLYLTTGAGSQGIYSVGTGKPTSSGNTATRLFTPTNTDPYGFSISPDAKTIYYVASTTGGIYRSTFDGTNWTAGTLISSATGMTGIAVDWSGYTFSTSGANGAKIYANTPTVLYSANDNGTSVVTPTTLRTLTGNNGFRGLAFSPIKQSVSKGSSTPATGNISSSGNNVVLFQFNVSADEGNSTVKSVVVTKSGTATIGAGNNIRNFRLVDDANNDGAASTAELTSPLATGTVSGNDITFSSIALSSYINQGSGKNFLVVADISGGVGNTFTPTITSDKSLNSVNYTTKVGNAGGSWVTIGGTAPTGNMLTIAATPSITGAATASAFTTTYGAASTAQTFSISGSNLTANLVATAPTGFEVSSDGTTYGGTATFSQTSGSASGTLYVRLTSTAVPGGTYNSQNIALTSTGATTVNIATASSGNSVGTKALTISGLTGVNKSYDGLTTASGTGTATLSGVVGSDAVTLGGTAVYAFSSAAVGTSKSITTTGYTITGGQSSYYTLTQPTLSADITVRSLTITANNVTKAAGAVLTSGSGSTAFTSSGLQNSETIGSVTITYGSGAAANAAGGVYAGAVVPSAATGGTFTASNYSISYTAGSITVNASPTITATGTLAAVGTTYGTASSSPTSFTVSGGNLTGDLSVAAPSGFEISTSSGSGYASSLSLAQSSGSVSSTTIYVRLAATTGAGTYSGNVTITGGGATAQNVATASSTVAPKVLTITGLTFQNKVYDRTTAALATGTAALSGVESGDTANVSLGGTPAYAFASSGVGTAIAISTTGYSISGSASGNYSLTQPSSTANITAAPLTVTSATVTTKPYDGNNTAAITGAQLNGVISPDVVTLTGGTSGTFANANVGTGIAVSTTMGITGAGALNYSLTAPTGLTGDITKASQTILGVAATTTKTFGETAYSLGASVASGQTLSYSSDNNAVATVSSAGLVTIVGVGSANISVSQAGNDNYSAATTVTQALTVNKANQTITFGALASKLTTDVPFTLNATASSGGAVTYTSSNTGVATVLGNTVTIVGPGTTTITASSAASANYNAATDVIQSLIVNPPPTTLAAGDVAVIGYNASGTPDTITLLILKDLNPGTIFYVSDNEVGTAGGTTWVDTGEAEATFTVSSGQTIAAGTVVVLPWGNQTVTDSRFTWTGHTGGGLSITSGNFDDGIYVYTGSSPTATPTAFIYFVKGGSSGTNAGNVPSGLTDGTTSINPTAAASRYKLTGATYSGTATQLRSAVGSLSNWDSTAPGSASDWTFSITQPQTITFASLSSKTYGDSTFDLTATASSGLTVSYASANTAVATVSGSTVTIVGAGTTIITASQAGNSSYAAATSVQQTLTVAAKSLTGSFTADNKFYDGTTAATVLTRSVSGKVGSDDVSLSGGTATFANALVGNAKTVTLAGASLAGTTASNYTLGSVSTTTANITAAVLASGDITLTSNGDGSYTASATGGASFTYSYAGRSANGITTSYSSATAPTAAGYYTVSATATGNYSGFNSENYFVTGPVVGNDSSTKPANNTQIMIPTATLLANDSRIHTDGTRLTDNLSITAVANGTGSAEIRGAFVLFSPSSAVTDNFTYTLTDSVTGKTATATVTVTTETEAPAFTLQIVKVGTAAFAGGNTTVTHDFIGVPGQTYLVEYKGDLAEASWTSAGAQPTGSTGSFSVTFTKAGDHTTDWNGSMFFQARRQ